jgi:hypothetical protein
LKNSRFWETADGDAVRSALHGRSNDRKLGAFASIDPADMAVFVKNINAGKFRDFVPEGLAQGQRAQQNASVVMAVPAMAQGILTGS